MKDQPYVPSESAIRIGIQKALTRHGAKVIPTTARFSAVVGTPDLVGCYRGRALAIEVKRPGRHPTRMQAVQLREWREAGAIAGVARSVADALRLVGIEDPANRAG